MIKATKRFLVLMLFAVPAYEASAVEPVYLDCSEVIWTRDGEPPIDLERRNYVRVFKDLTMETVNVDWSWYDAKQTVRPDQYCGGEACLERDTLELSIWSLFKYEKRQCKIMTEAAFEEVKAAALRKIREEEETQRKKNIL